MNRWIFILILISSLNAAVVHAGDAPSPCTAKLDLLDSGLKKVLDGMIALYVEQTSIDPESGMAVKLQELIREKTEDLQKIIPDLGVQAAAKEYIQDQVATLHNEHQMKMGDQEITDDKIREDEAKFFFEKEESFRRPYMPAGIEDIEIDHNVRPIFTAEGIFIGAPLRSGGTLLVFDVVHNVTKRLHFEDNDFKSFQIRYAEGSGELFVMNKKQLSIINIHDVLKNPEGYIYADNVLSLIPTASTTGSSLARIRNWIKYKWTLRQGRPKWAAFDGFKVSGDGKFIVEHIVLDPARSGPEKFLFTMYNRDLDQRNLTRNAVVKNKLNWGIAEWEMSSDGRLVGMRDTVAENPPIFGIRIFDTHKGKEVIGPISIGDGNDHGRFYGFIGHNMVYSVGPNKIILFNPLKGDASEKRIFEIPGKPLTNYPVMTVSADDSTMYMSDGKTLWVWNVNSGELIHQVEIKTNEVQVTRDQKFVMKYNMDLHTASFLKRRY